MSAQSKNGRPHTLHLNEETMRKFQDRSLAVEERRAAHHHLNGCGSCRRALLARMGPVRLPEEIAEIPEPLHLSYEQITAYVDDQLDSAGKARADAHLFLCASCSRELAGLRKLDARLAASPARAIAAPVPEPKEPLSTRIARYFRAPGRTRDLGLAFGVIVIGLFLFQAGDRTTAVSRTAARLIHLGSDSSAGLSYGGYAFIAAGLAYMLFSLLRRR
jgi:Putative zinc-finger